MNFQSLLKTADQLKIKGLCESPEEKENSEATVPFVSRPYSKIRKISSPKHFKTLDSSRKPRIKKEKVDRGNSSDQDEDIDINKDNGQFRNTSDEESENGVEYDEACRKRKQSHPQTKPLNMSSHGMMTGQVRNCLENLILIFKNLHKQELLLDFFYASIRIIL